MLTLLAAAEGNNVLVPHTGELVVGTLAFFLLFWLLSRKAYPQIQKTYADRADRIEGGMRRAEEAQLEAQRTLEQYRAQLAQARQEANRIREDARVQGQRIVEDLRARAQEDAAGIVARAEQRIEADRAQAFAELRRDIGRLAVDLSGRIVGESLQDGDRQRRLIDRFLSELEGTGDRRALATDVVGGGDRSATPVGARPVRPDTPR